MPHLTPDCPSPGDRDPGLTSRVRKELGGRGLGVTAAGRKELGGSGPGVTAGGRSGYSMERAERLAAIERLTELEDAALFQAAEARALRLEHERRLEEEQRRLAIRRRVLKNLATGGGV